MLFEKVIPLQPTFVDHRPQQRLLQAAGWFAVAVCACICGCGQGPQFQPQNRPLLSSLRTAVSAKQSDWLQQNVDKIQAGVQAGTISKFEADTLQPVIDLAKKGEWAEANRLIFEIESAQRATSDDLERVDAGKVSHAH